MSASDFELLLRQAIEAARWAPSSHNCQPWRVAVVPGACKNERLLRLTLDQGRRLTALESLDLEMALSVGLFLGLLVTALQRLGLACEWALDNESGPSPKGEIPMAIVIVRRTSARVVGGADLESFVDLARRRRTCRAPFAPDPPSAEAVAAMSARRWPETLSGASLEVRVEMDPKTLKSVAELTSRYAALDFTHLEAWSETYRYLRFREPGDEDVADGIFIDSLLGPLTPFKRHLLRFVLAPLAMQALRPFGGPSRMADALAGLVAAGPGLVCCSLPEERPRRQDLLQAGARLAEIWLNAQAAGLALHPVSVLLQHEAPRRELQRLISLSSRPVFVARFGLALPNPTTSPRRPVDAILRLGDRSQ